MTLAVPGESVARGASPIPYIGTVTIGAFGLALLNNWSEPRRNPAAVGRNCTFTLQDMVSVVPATQVVPAVTTVKSRLAVPRGKACTLPSVEAKPTENGKATIVPDPAPTGRGPKPTVESCTSEIPLKSAT